MKAMAPTALDILMLDMSYNFDDLSWIFVGPLTLLKLDLSYETTSTIMQRIWTNNG
jgi:hypothetical protein